MTTGLPAQQIQARLAMIAAHAPIRRRVVRAGERLFHAVDRFDRLYIVNTGICKSVGLTADGREQVLAVHFKGDWLGLCGISSGCYGTEAVAIDTGEVWSLTYRELLDACMAEPALLRLFHEAMSRELQRERNSMLAFSTLPADARVAEFLRWWADALEQRGLRADSVRLPMSRAEIGNYLGMTLESVSRALSRLERGNVIRFADRARRDIEIPALAALGEFVAECTAMREPAAAAHALH